MLYQNRPDFPGYIQHYACLSMVLARSREIVDGKPWTAREFIEAWELAMKREIVVAGARTTVIAGDLNGDGDLDDAGEACIQDYDELFKLWGLPLKTTDPRSWPQGKDENGVWRTLPVSVPFDPKRYWVAERWKHKISHFVQGDGTGARRPAYDSIYPESQTRKLGKIMDLRVFERTR